MGEVISTWSIRRVNILLNDREKENEINEMVNIGMQYASIAYKHIELLDTINDLKQKVKDLKDKVQPTVVLNRWMMKVKRWPRIFFKDQWKFLPWWLLSKSEYNAHLWKRILLSQF